MPPAAISAGDWIIDFKGDNHGYPWRLSRRDPQTGMWRHEFHQKQEHCIFYGRAYARIGKVDLWWQPVGEGGLWHVEVHRPLRSGKRWWPFSRKVNG